MTAQLVPEDSERASPAPPPLSIVLPCRNEEESVAACIQGIRDALSGYEGWYEIVVVDNGSTDRSHMRAVAAGARVVSESRPGYGNACRAGLDAAAGDIAVLADADGTYDFSILPTFVEMMETGVQLALGSRLRGNIEKGAMPWLHRIGTPFLNSLVNRLFGTSVSDVNCGIRAIDLDAYRRLDLTASGMEFASEMVVRAAEVGLVLAETPVDYRLRTGGEPKLRTWSDGFRHMRLVMASRARRPFRRSSPKLAGGRARSAEPELPKSGVIDADRPRI